MDEQDSEDRTGSGISPKIPDERIERRESDESAPEQTADGHANTGPDTDSDAEDPKKDGKSKKDPDKAPDARSQVHHNNVNQYFLGALDAPEMHFGISGAESSQARRRAVGRLDAGEADAVLASYVEPDGFDDAVVALQQDGVVVLVGPSGSGKRAAAVALIATVAEDSDYVVLSPGRSLEDLAGGRVEFTRGVGYVLFDRMHESHSGTADFDWRRVRDTVRERGAHLVVTTVHEAKGRLGSVCHLRWQSPDLSAVLRVRLTHAGCEPETVQTSADLMPQGCRIAEVVEAADRIGRGERPGEVWRDYGTGAAAPVRDWFAEERTPQEWAEATTLAFVHGAGYRDFETCQERLEQWVAKAFPAPADGEEAAAAARRAADRRLSLSRNSLVLAEERKTGALTRTALVFPHPQYRQWVLRELWAARSTAYWDGVREWLTELLSHAPADLDLQLTIAQALALLTPTAFDEVADSYLHPWARGAAGPAGQSTATLALHCMCLEESLAAVALGLARAWADSYHPALRSTAIAGFSGELGVRFPTDAVSTLLRLAHKDGGRSTEAAFALAGLVAVLAECKQDTGAVFRPLAYRLHVLRETRAGKDWILDTVLIVLRARDVRTGRPVCADVLARSPEHTETLAGLWAGVLGNLPRRARALAGLHRTR
ncbi:MAG: hypothetical protein LBV60_15925 [Streptomyces sp.]|jgi:hypothetical protein|nr:hypothetical protein [Streptomyces sp.]